MQGLCFAMCQISISLKLNYLRKKQFGARSLANTIKADCGQIGAHTLKLLSPHLSCLKFKVYVSMNGGWEYLLILFYSSAPPVAANSIHRCPLQSPFPFIEWPCSYYNLVLWFLVFWLLLGRNSPQLGRLFHALQIFLYLP